MNTDEHRKQSLFFVLSVFICVYPWPIMSLPGLEEITLIPRHQESRNSSRRSGTVDAAREEGRDESRPSRQECLRHENGLIPNSTTSGVLKFLIPGLTWDDSRPP